MKRDDDFSIESSRAWKLLPSWLMELWMAWILAAFFLIRVLGSRAAQSFVSWLHHLR